MPNASLRVVGIDTYLSLGGTAGVVCRPGVAPYMCR
jgi:hypothetical protein